MGAIAMKGLLCILETPALLESHPQIVSCHIQDTRWGMVLPVCMGADDVFYNSSSLGWVVTDGRIKKDIDKHNNKIPGITSLYEIKKNALCGTAHFPKRVQSVYLEK